MGRPSPYEQSRPLTIAELDLDRPAPGEALVRIEAAGLCHSDLSVIDGSRPRPMPMVLGHEAAGVVEETGPGVTGFSPGDHVVFSFVPVCGTCVACQSGRPSLCEEGARANTAGALLSGERRFHDGHRRLNHHLGVSGFAERTVASTASLVRIPDSIPFDRAALFGCALLTGVGAVVNTARVPPGSSVVVFGLGGVGLSIVMGARLAGCHPIVVVDTVQSKLDLARDVGASHPLPAGEGAVEEIRDVTGGGGEFVFEAVGSAQVLASAYAATRRGGTTVAVGLAHPEHTLEIPAVSLVAEERRLIGSYMGSAAPRRDIPRLLSLYQSGLLPVDALLGRTLDLDEINSGFDALDQGGVVRQIVIPAA
jgi:alcohol dehydrogenase